VARQAQEQRCQGMIDTGAPVGVQGGSARALLQQAAEADGDRERLVVGTASLNRVKRSSR
jgi:hypothetical protein